MKVKAKELIEKIENNKDLKNAEDDENDPIGESYEDMSQRILSMDLPKQKFEKDVDLENFGVYEHKPNY